MFPSRDSHSASIRTGCERHPAELSRLRAEIFAIELELDRQRHLETGESMPQHWATFLERTRQSLLSESSSRATSVTPRSISPLPPHSPSLHTTYKLQDHSALIVSLTSVFADVGTYRRLLSCQGTQARALLDTFQMLLDLGALEDQFRNNISVAMSRLSGKTRLYPRHYDLEDILADDQPVTSGGFADIYKALYHGEFVCLKAIRVYDSSRVEHVQKKFFREAILWGQLSHPNVLPFYGLYQLRSQLCLVSPWAENGNLRDFLKCNRTANRFLLCSDTAAGVAYLHANDIIHGDLKGANVLVMGSGRACLADFGISAVTDPLILSWTSHSPSSSKGGCIRWQAPELNNTDEVTPNTKESDVYAWSCVCYEIFTGRLPFYEYTRDPTVTLRILLGELPSRPPASSDAWITWGMTEQIWDLMNNCWKPKPTDRPVMDRIVQQLSLDKPIDLRPVSQSTSSFRAARPDLHSSVEIISAIMAAR